MIHFDLNAVPRNGYWEAVGRRAGEDTDPQEFVERDPAESAEAHDPTITINDDPWTRVDLNKAPF
jgi:hypothetical protein